MSLVVGVYVATIWLENWISYDDGGLGVAAFFVVLTLGRCGLLFSDLVTRVAGPLYHATGIVGVIYSIVVVVVACLPYLILDHLATLWLLRAHAGDGGVDVKAV